MCLRLIGCYSTRLHAQNNTPGIARLSVEDGADGATKDLRLDILGLAP
jgi:hypothetical protein